ncbi:MAG: hypothetical protein IPG32_04925 [Saprospirales bacterium]|nr:hypothetical protein [Saprospirales bacterium]
MVVILDYGSRGRYGSDEPAVGINVFADLVGLQIDLVQLVDVYSRTSRRGRLLNAPVGGIVQVRRQYDIVLADDLNEPVHCIVNVSLSVQPLGLIAVGVMLDDLSAEFRQYVGPACFIRILHSFLLQDVPDGIVGKPLFLAIGVSAPPFFPLHQAVQVVVRKASLAFQNAVFDETDIAVIVETVGKSLYLDPRRAENGMGDPLIGSKEGVFDDHPVPM